MSLRYTAKDPYRPQAKNALKPFERYSAARELGYAQDYIEVLEGYLWGDEIDDERLDEARDAYHSRLD